MTNCTTTVPAYLTTRIEAVSPCTTNLYAYVRPAGAPTGRGHHFYYTTGRCDLPTLAQAVREDLRNVLQTEVPDDLLYDLATALRSSTFNDDPNRYHGD